MEMEDGKVSALEAVLFACGDSVDTARLSAAIEAEEKLIPGLVEQLNQRYDSGKSALRVAVLDGSYQLVTRQGYGEAVRRALETKHAQPLSPAAMEVLTVIAYNQPVTKGFVEHVRGVDSSSVVNSLIEKGLLEEAGRLDVPGRPLAYQTTDNFLRCFQLQSLADLPPLPDSAGQMSFEEILLDKENTPGPSKKEE